MTQPINEKQITTSRFLMDSALSVYSIRRKLNKEQIDVVAKYIDWLEIYTLAKETELKGGEK